MLKTYPNDDSHDLVIVGPGPAYPRPGDRVTFVNDRQAKGLVVGISDEEITVLWSSTPDMAKVTERFVLHELQKNTKKLFSEGDKLRNTAEGRRKMVLAVSDHLMKITSALEEPPDDS